MNEMNDVVMIFLLMIGGIGIPMGLYLAFRAAMATIKGMEADAVTKRGIDLGHVAELEQRVADLEDRLVFTEGVLAEKTAGRLDG
jgi:uncharacterized small protein (DUF1192 family)